MVRDVISFAGCPLGKSFDGEAEVSFFALDIEGALAVRVACVIAAEKVVGMNLLITEVTEMHGGNYCVAGWRAETGTMVRPLPDGANWTAALLAQHGVVPGATLSVQSNGTQPNSAYPHRTEDTPIDPVSINLVSRGSGHWFGSNAPPTAATLVDAFEGNVRHNSSWDGVLQGVHVPAGVQSRSLWAVAIHRARLSLVEDFQKLKAILDDGAAKYKLAVSSCVLKEAWQNGGLAGADQALPRTGNLHVRVGLARTFGTRPDKCYVMVNGVQW